ncbi:hypothetical protein DRO19_05065 [Candidatus Bathyarchaeota archaeon]|nr:MAG: hypothetical protein DRO19_05065 [Candidatus Bathyarchaeota archaeon]
MKIKGRITTEPFKTPLFKIESYNVKQSAGELINSYAICEVVRPDSSQPCFAYRQKGKEQTFFLNEIEIPNLKLRLIPIQRLPWLLCREPKDYGSVEQLWDEVKQALYYHLELRQKQEYDVLTSWVLMTWTIEKFNIIPYIFFFGTWESGKTRGLELLQNLAYRGWLMPDISEASLFRVVDSLHPTLLIDEAEALAKRPEIRALLNSGYKRGATVPRQTVTPEGTYITEWFETFAPKALASTELLAKTTMSRCIVFKMSKAQRKIPILLDTEWLADLRDKLLAYRFNTLLSEESEENEDFQKTTPLEKLAEATGSNRLAELFLAPYTVAPARYKSTIMEYAQLVGAERLGELVSTEEILVLGAIVKCYDLGKISKSLILVGDIVDTINQELSYKEYWTNRRVVEVATRLGFRKKRTNRGTAIIYDSRLIERLKKDIRYRPAFQPEEIEAPFSGNASQSSQSSPTENWLSEGRT